ncbi:MAG: hypothetical protein AAGG68_09230 [Bacteroidota bacterium]
MKSNTVLKLIGIAALVVLIILLGIDVAEAQCPMCRMSAEQNLKDGGTAGKGLNAGILYMLATPYVVVGTVALIWWRNRKKKNEE